MSRTRFVIGLATIVFALVLLDLTVEWLVQNTFFGPEVGIVLVGSLGFGFFALHKREVPGLIAYFRKTRQGQVTATVVAVVTTGLAIGAGAGLLDFLLVAGLAALLVAVAATSGLLITGIHTGEAAPSISPAPTMGSVIDLARWSAGLGIAACITFGICTIALFRENPSGRHLLGLIVGLLLVMSLTAGVAAVITGHMSMRQIRRLGAKGVGMARTGLISGYLFLAVFVLSFPLTSFALLYTQCNPQAIGDCS